MMSRLELHEVLCDILGSRKVYFQPPESIKISYPSIVYKRNDINPKFANNKQYTTYREYEVTLLDANPDSPFVKQIEELEYCEYVRNFQTSGINHDVFKIKILKGE